MRKRSKNKALLDKADRALQDYYRTKKLKCESCGKLSNLVHHFIEKSRCNFLRFNDKNLIPLCSKCHSLHHCFGDSTIMGNVVLKRGRKWYNTIQKLRRESLGLDEEYLSGILEKYK